jgi:Replication-relaxation
VLQSEEKVEVIRFLLWRLLGVVAVFVGFALIAWFLDGGPGKALRGSAPAGKSHMPVDGSHDTASGLASVLDREVRAIGSLIPAPAFAYARLFLALVLLLSTIIAIARWRARRRRCYVRLRIDAYRGDRASAEAVVAMFEALHKRLLRRWWRRLVLGQPAVSLEVHHTPTPSPQDTAGADGRSRPSLGGTGRIGPGDSARELPHSVWLAVSCPQGLQKMIEAALQTAYPNCRVRSTCTPIGSPAALLRLKKHAEFIRRVKVLDHFEHERQPPVNRLMTVMGACGGPAFVQIAMTPTPAFFERLARHLYKRREARLSRERREHVLVRDRSMVAETELRGGLQVQHRPLFFVDLRVGAWDRGVCEAIASELRAQGAENRLIERGTTVRQGLLGLYDRRLRRGEGNPLPSFVKGVFASTELAAIWQLPSVDYLTVPFAWTTLPIAPASPAILRPGEGMGTLRDALGAVSIHQQLRRQNTAVPGAVEQGKSSYLVATVAEDLRRERCAVILLDPKGDAAEAAVSLVPERRTCTLLDFSHPMCGFNPLAVDAPADVIADYVVAALKNLFTDADIRASSDRYLRNAIIAVLAYDRESTLWDAARLLSVGEEGYSYRRTVGAGVRTLPEFKEISEFFTAELTAQLADARSTTTAKLDAPVNKLARLLNSASIKRVLLNSSLTVDFDRVIAAEEVLVVKGALGAMGAGNTSVLMQLLVGMLDAALARQQDLVPAHRRVAVALKVDEAPLVINRGFAETMALKRSAGLETVACWQTEAQWTDREVRDHLDAMFAHRVYFATASARDARSAVQLTMAEFSDTVRPGIEHLSPLGRPDVRLRLPKHHAIASWSTPDGRQPPFIAQTVPLHVDRGRLTAQIARQRERGGRHLTDLRQPHWDRRRRGSTSGGSEPEITRRRAAATPAQTAAQPGPRQPNDPSGIIATRLPDSYRELVELDDAHSVRWAKRVQSPRALQADRLDLEVLALVAGLGHVLTSQIHRRFNPGRAATTTQRRLKRLSDAGLVERFQFHRRDGGGVPMCYVITAAGMALIGAEGRLDAQADGAIDAVRAVTAARSENERQLRQARHDVHVAGWALALAQVVGYARATLRGARESALSPPLRSTPDGRAAIGPADLRLPGGRTPHDFLRTNVAGQSFEVDHFETIRPDAIVEVFGGAHVDTAAGKDGDRAPSLTAMSASTGADAAMAGTASVDVMIELDDRLSSAGAGKLRRYDHFLAGWSMHVSRYGRRLEALPIVVFLCRDRVRARECARRSDATLRACRAYAGEYPFDWDYPGRERILFASERDMHEGLPRAYGVRRLPPEVRVAASHGDPRAGEAVAEAREILVAVARSSE